MLHGFSRQCRVHFLQFYTEQLPISSVPTQAQIIVNHLLPSFEGDIHQHSRVRILHVQESLSFDQLQYCLRHYVKFLDLVSEWVTGSTSLLRIDSKNE